MKLPADCLKRRYDIINEDSQLEKMKKKKKGDSFQSYVIAIKFIGRSS